MENAGFDIIREDKGRVRIVPKMRKLPNIEQYINLAEDILKKGIQNNGDINLMNSESRDILDSVQLMYEFKQNFNKVKKVIFSYKSKDVEVTTSNIDNIPSIIRAIDEQERHKTAIIEAVLEGLEK